MSDSVVVYGMIRKFFGMFDEVLREEVERFLCRFYTVYIPLIDLISKTIPCTFIRTTYSTWKSARLFPSIIYNFPTHLLTP